MRHFMTKRRIFGAAVGLVVAGLGLGLPEFVRAAEDGTTPPMRRLPVATMVTEASERFETTRSYTGRIAARRVADLAFERGGLLLAVEVDEGDAVIAGAPLARLDTREIDLEREGVVAEHAGAKALLREMVNGPRRQTIEAARAIVHDLESQLSLAKKKEKRRIDLNEANDSALADEVLEEVESLRLSVHARLARAEHVLDELEAGTRKEKIAAQEAVVKRLDARIASIDVAIAKSVLRAPFAGIISARLADEGTVPGIGAALLTLVESGQLEARIGIPSDDGERIAIGAEASIRVDGKQVEARLRARHPQLDESTRTQLHIFTLDSAPAGVVRGQVARISLRVNVAAQGIWVPTTALVRAPRGLWACYVVDGEGVVGRREVSVVHTDGARAYVNGTLRGGERVIRSGAHRVVQGQHVQVKD